MRPPRLTMTCIGKGEALQARFPALEREIARALEGAFDAQGRPWTLKSAGLEGNYSLLVLLCDDEPAGAMSYEALGDDVRVHFCHVGEEHTGFEGQFFTMAVRRFLGDGAAVVRSNFLWPSPGPCIEAALAMGFARVERAEMARENDGSYPDTPPVDGIVFRPWSDGCLAAVARILCENGNEIDRRIYPQEQTFAGASAQLKKITGGMYGDFLPGLSTIACAGGRPVGMSLATEYGGDAILLAQIVVEKGYRGRGIAGAMIAGLIRDSARRGPRKITLAVNTGNEPAIKLYERHGFRRTFVFRQYILAGLQAPS